MTYIPGGSSGGSIATSSDVALNNAATNEVLMYDGGIGKWKNAVAPTATEATTTVKGTVQLAGDLGGTAAAPTVPGLAGKAAADHTHDGRYVRTVNGVGPDANGNVSVTGSGGDEPVSPEPLDPMPVISNPTRTITVNNRTEFLAAIAPGTLAWGDKIVLTGTSSSPTEYGSTSTNTVITTPSLSGYTVDNPPPGIHIVAQNRFGALFSRGGYTSGYSIFFDRASYVQFEGVMVRGGQKSFMAHYSNYNRLVDCDFGFCGMELVHFRIFSSFNIVLNCEVHDSGQASGQEGKSEGIYFGQAESTWDSIYEGDTAGGNPDTSDGNQAISCNIYNTKSECIDIKEGTTGGVIRGCTMSGSQISGVNNADSYIDVKGNDYLIEGNTCTSPSTAVIHGIETHINYPGYGNRNVFKNNSIVAGNKTGSVPNSSDGSNGINILLSGSRGSATGNVVYDDNAATNAPGGLTNIPTTVASSSSGSRTVTAATTLTASDRYVRIDSSSAVSQPIPAGISQLKIVQVGQGQITLTAGTGVTLNFPKKTAGQGRAVTLMPLGSAEYDVLDGIA